MSAMIAWLRSRYVVWRSLVRERYALGCRWIRREWDRRGPARRLVVVRGDMLPTSLPSRDVVLLRDDGEDWSVGMRCPCGCGETIELMLLRKAKPRWDLRVDEEQRPTLRPSVWRKAGCRSHFWLRQGRIAWCDSLPRSHRPAVVPNGRASTLNPVWQASLVQGEHRAIRLNTNSSTRSSGSAPRTAAWCYSIPSASSARHTAATCGLRSMKRVLLLSSRALWVP